MDDEHAATRLGRLNCIDPPEEVRQAGGGHGGLALGLGGRFDEATPTITEATHRAITGSEWVIFEHSAHLPHLEEPERYLQVLQDFLCRHDPAS